MKRFWVMFACLLLQLPLAASAQQVQVQFKGTVTEVRGVREGVLADVQVGEPVEGLAMFQPSLFTIAAGDGASFLRLRAPWTDGLDLLRSGLTIGDRRIDTEQYAYRLSNLAVDENRVPANMPPGSPPIDRFFVSDWSSPLDLSDLAVVVAPSRILNVTATAPGPSSFVVNPIVDLYLTLDWPAVTSMSGSILDGVGRRFSDTAWAFDLGDPPINPDRHAMQVIFSIESMSKVTCQNRVVWVDFGWPWPQHPITCAVSRRKH